MIIKRTKEVTASSREVLEYLEGFLSLPSCFDEPERGPYSSPTFSALLRNCKWAVAAACLPRRRILTCLRKVWKFSSQRTGTSVAKRGISAAPRAWGEQDQGSIRDRTVALGPKHISSLSGLDVWGPFPTPPSSWCLGSPPSLLLLLQDLLTKDSLKQLTCRASERADEVGPSLASGFLGACPWSNQLGQA